MRARLPSAALKPQLGLVTPAVQAGDAGGVLQDAAALLGLGVDELADLALPHQRRRARTRRSILEQDAHIAGAHLPPVDAEGRARLALDAPRHLQRVMRVELGRRLAAGVVDEDGDFRRIARRPRLGAGKDHVVHGGRAHALVRGLAHHPAQRLEQVRLAAAVGADDAGQPLLDHELGRLHERLEAQQPQPVDVHSANTQRRLGRSKRRPNTIELARQSCWVIADA